MKVYKLQISDKRTLAMASRLIRPGLCAQDKREALFHMPRRHNWPKRRPVKASRSKDLDLWLNGLKAFLEEEGRCLT